MNRAASDGIGTVIADASCVLCRNIYLAQIGRMDVAFRIPCDDPSTCMIPTAEECAQGIGGG